MTRKDYIAIAKIFNEVNAAAAHPALTAEQRASWNGALFAAAVGLANVMRADSPRFDRDRFIDACGVRAVVRA